MTEPTGRCPVDDAPAPRSARYPRALCMDCVELATDLRGRPVAMMNVSFNGGFQAVHRDDGQACVQVGYNGLVLVRGVRCFADEARFGGVVVQPGPCSYENPRVDPAAVFDCRVVAGDG